MLIDGVNRIGMARAGRDGLVCKHGLGYAPQIEAIAVNEIAHQAGAALAGGYAVPADIGPAAVGRGADGAMIAHARVAHVVRTIPGIGPLAFEPSQLDSPTV